MTRDCESILIVGAQKTGKSTFADNILRSTDRKALVVDSEGLEKLWQKYPIIKLSDVYRLKKGRARIIFDDYDEDPNFFKTLKKTFRNGIILFDDAPYYLEDYRGKYFQKILMKNRQTNNDVIWICHGITAVPPGFWKFFSILVVFNTTETFESRKKSVPTYDLMVDRVMEVRKLALKDPHAHKIYRLR